MAQHLRTLHLRVHVRFQVSPSHHLQDHRDPIRVSQFHLRQAVLPADVPAHQQVLALAKVATAVDLHGPVLAEAQVAAEAQAAEAQAVKVVQVAEAVQVAEVVPGEARVVAHQSESAVVVVTAKNCSQ